MIFWIFRTFLGSLCFAKKVCINLVFDAQTAQLLIWTQLGPPESNKASCSAHLKPNRHWLAKPQTGEAVRPLGTNQKNPKQAFVEQV